MSCKECTVIPHNLLCDTVRYRPSLFPFRVESLQLCTRLNLWHLCCCILHPDHQTPSSHFFTFDHAHCRYTARVSLSSNCMQLPKPRNNVKFCIVSTSHHGQFHLDRLKDHQKFNLAGCLCGSSLV